MFLSLLTAMTMTVSAQKADVDVKTGTYGNDWNSLSAWECPEWFKNAKFGIWAHCGPQCQAEDGDWYARFMYYAGSGQYNYHVSHFGNPKDFGLKELCNAWKADQWNPQELVNLYKSVGARYFMVLGNHHDNFDNWDSPYQEWNSVNVGPKKDLVKGWSEACKEAGLPLGVSIHASHAWTWLEPSQNYDGNLTKADGVGKWWEGMDPQELYAQKHTHSTGWENSGTIHSQWDWGNGASLPSKAYKQKFQNRVLQLINDYNPDMIYFDDTAMPFYGCDDRIGKNILQHYYNHSAMQHDGKAEVVVTGKQLNEEQKDYMMWDVERGIPDRPQSLYWQTCTCIGDWHYNQNVYNNNSYKSGATVVRMLIDVVSKNGNLLLSIPVKGNGTIDDKERTVLADIKAWMDINSQSIYDTRPWKTFGEGPLAEASNPMNAQGFNEGQSYSNQDVRYVEKNDTVYATIMDWPAAGDFTFNAFSIVENTYSGEVDKVTLLGSGEVEFSQGIKGLTVKVPAKRSNRIAPVFCITFKTDIPANELLQMLINESETAVEEFAAQAHPYNTGKVNAEKLEQLQTAIALAKTIPSTASDEEINVAREALITAYRSFRDNGLNPGGAFNGMIEANLTTEYLVETSNFTRSAGGSRRFGSPANWTVENFNIPNGNDGTKQGLDKYSGNETLMLGVWNDADKNTKGSLKNARIYRKITLPAGKYYFGAAYNTTYSINPQAYMFVSKTLCETADIPAQSIAYYGIENCTGDLKLQGLYFSLDEKTELYIGFQANLLNGSATQEFRVERVVLYSPKEGGEMHSETNGWQKLTELPNDVSQYFFAIYEHNTDLGLVLDKGNHQGSSYQTIWYQANVYPETNKNALWTFDAFGGNNRSGVTGSAASWIVITGVGDTDHCLQSYDNNTWNYRTDNNGEGWTDRAYITPAYLAEGAWTFRNNKGGNYLGRWDGSDEIAGNITGDNVGQYDIYAILRGQYVAVAENIEKASEENPIDISYLITNADATRMNNFHSKQPVGWTLSSDDAFEVEYANYLSCKVGDSYFNKWQGSPDLSDRTISQQLTGLPTGRYRLSVKASPSTIHAGAFLFANTSEEALHTVTNNTGSVTTDITSGTLTFGIKLTNYQSNDCKFDHFTLEYLGDHSTQTSINKPQQAIAAPKPIYDLNGRRRTRLEKGINIVGDKKMLVK